VAGVVTAAILATYPTLRCRFVGADDTRLLLDHPLVGNPSWTNAAKLLARQHYDLYQPIPLLFYMAEYRAFGRSPLGYHIDRIGLHAVNALLLWLLVWLLARRRWPAALAAVAFALHPLAIETIASVAKVTIPLSTAMTFVCMIAYVRWRDLHRPAWYVVSLLACIMAMLCKPIVTLPLGLVLIDAYRARRFDWRWLASLLPFAIIVAGALLLNLHTTGQAGLSDQAREQLAGPVVPRMLLVSQWALTKYIWPASLSPWYPPPEYVGWLEPPTIAGLAAFVGSPLLAIVLVRRLPMVGFGLGMFVAYLLPYQGSLIARNLMSADRFMYLPMAGLHIAAVGVLLYTGQRIIRAGPDGAAVWLRTVGLTCAAVLAVCWTAISWQTSNYYLDGLARARRLVQLYPEQPEALDALARMLEIRLRSAPADLPTLLELDALLARRGTPHLAPPFWQTAVEAAGGDPVLNGWSALALAGAEQYESARREAEAVLNEHPRVLPARLALMLTDLATGNDSAATAIFEELPAGIKLSAEDLVAIQRATISVSALGSASPDNPVLLWISSKLLILQGEPAYARMFMQHLAERFPESRWSATANDFLREHSP
jgi:hypothetical protein